MANLARLRKWLDRHPRFKAVAKSVSAPFRSTVSSGYMAVKPQDAESVALALESAWKEDSIPEMQREHVERALAEYRAGASIRGFDLLVDQLKSVLREGEVPTVLEVGCSSGYLAEVFEIKSLPLNYSGCDFSPSFIDLARRCYPTIDFRVADATRLSYEDESFDVVLSGCCLLHIREYDRAIAEAARVAKRFVLFHRTPVVHAHPTRYFTKSAYGVKTIEIHFNEEELVGRMRHHGLRILEVATLDASWRGGDATATKTYLCEKTPK